MKTSLASIVFLLALTSALAAGQTPAARTKTVTGPRTDSEVQTCISEKFKVSTSIKGGTVSVKEGMATLSGEATSGGAKGGATRSARACGAKEVTNNIAVPSKPKSKTKTAGKTQ